jgi:hypothetical protein
MVVDGLGSGPFAAAAALSAVDCLRKKVEPLGTCGDPAAELGSLMQHCDHALRGTRGAALGLALLDGAAGWGYYGGVGNVEMRVVGRKPAHPACQAGIVGNGVRKVRVERFAYEAGDLVIMHSDGLSSRFQIDAQLALAWSMEVLGEKLVREHGKVDDMTLLLMRQHA